MAGDWQNDRKESRPREPQAVLQKLLQQVPGFQGYADATARRVTDDRSRAHIAERLGQSKQALDGLARQWIDAGQIDSLPKLDRTRGRIDVLLARLRGGPLAGAKFIDASKIEETLLQDLLDLDLEIVQQVEKFSTMIAAQSTEPADQAIACIETELTAISTTLNRRAAVAGGSTVP